MKWTCVVKSATEMIELGQRIGQCSRGGEIIELKSDLGGGKTTFTRGLALGVGSEDEVSSPSFTINNRYVGTKLTIEHFDFYRLTDAGVMSDELREYMGRADTVVVIEWGDIVCDVLPGDRAVCTISLQADDSRVVEVQLPDSISYLLETEDK